MKQALQNIALHMNQQIFHSTSVNELHGEEKGFYLDLDLINYKWGDQEQFILFELLISEDGKCRSVSVQYNDSLTDEPHHTWDSFKIPPSSFDVMNLLKHVEDFNSETKPLVVDLTAVREVDTKIKSMINYIEQQLRKC